MLKNCSKQTAAKVHNSPWKYWSHIYTQTYHERRLINYQLSINLGENLCRLNMFLQLALHVRYLCETQGNVTNSRNIGKDISEHLDKKKKKSSRGKSYLCCIIVPYKHILHLHVCLCFFVTFTVILTKRMPKSLFCTLRNGANTLLKRTQSLSSTSTQGSQC